MIIILLIRLIQYSMSRCMILDACYSMHVTSTDTPCIMLDACYDTRCIAVMPTGCVIDTRRMLLHDIMTRILLDFM